MRTLPPCSDRSSKARRYVATQAIVADTGFGAEDEYYNIIRPYLAPSIRSSSFEFCCLTSNFDSQFRRCHCLDSSTDGGIPCLPEQIPPPDAAHSSLDNDDYGTITIIDDRGSTYNSGAITRSTPGGREITVIRPTFDFSESSSSIPRQTQA